MITQTMRGSSKIQLRQLAVFIEVARNGTIHKAATALGVSQPAVTRTIKELEAALGLNIFNRSRSGVSLTVYGQSLLNHAVAAMAEVNAALAELEAMKHTASGHVTLGGPTVSLSRLVPRAVARLKKRTPFVNVTVISGAQAQLLASLKIGEIDIFFGRRGTAAEMTDLSFESLFQDRLVIVARPEHPLAGRTSLDLGELADFPWVLPLADDRLIEFIRMVFRKRRIAFPKNCVELSFGISMWTYMEDTNAIAVMPSNLVSQDVRAGRLVVLKGDADWALPSFGIGYRSKASLTPPARGLVTELRRVAAQRRTEMSELVTAFKLSK